MPEEGSPAASPAASRPNLPSRAGNGGGSFVKSSRFSEEDSAALVLATGARRLVAGANEREVAPSEVDPSEAQALLQQSRRGGLRTPRLWPVLPDSASEAAKLFSTPIVVKGAVVSLFVIISASLFLSMLPHGQLRGVGETSARPQINVRSTNLVYDSTQELEVAIIGCGLAGAATALELLMQTQKRIRITIYEQSPTLLTSTSSIIAGTINFDTPYRAWLHGKAMFSVYDMVRDGFTASALSSDTRWANFLMNTAAKMSRDPRADLTQKRKVFRESYEQLTRLVREFPRLCEALIGQWCCDAGDTTRHHLEDVAGVACPSSSDDPSRSTLGLFQLTSDVEMCAWMRQAASSVPNGCDDKRFLDSATCEEYGHRWHAVRYTFYNTSLTRERLSGFLQSETTAFCSLVEHRITGYARSEVLFSVVDDILTSRGVSVGLSCNVLALQPTDDVAGRVRVISDAGCSLGGTREYDRVVVAASAASVPLLAEVDPLLGNHLVGVKGYGLSGAGGSPQIPENQAGRGLHFMDMSRRFAAAYARATADSFVKVWGGHDVSATDEGVKPPYGFCSAEEEDKIFRRGPSCAAALVDVPTTTRLSGMRPVPSIGGVPLLKRYTGSWRNVLLNTGYGYNGYDLSWFASSCTSQWLTQDTLEHVPVCLAASKTGPEE
mmetsp:Transcript_124235/g.397672  ORF Transcript_124235/g.397672 Transcript_124235/m.397672 type:complete len:665 (+) Transcript_124235:3-1997(+)